MESNSNIILVFVPTSKSIRILRRADFHPIKGNILPEISSLLDGISRKDESEDLSNNNGTDNLDHELV